MTDHSKTAELLWNAPRTPRRGPRPSMTLDAVVAAGIDIADREGVAGVTMQKVAAALGATRMAVYRYVPGRDELLAVMLDRAMGAAPDLERGAGWRAAVADFAHRMYAVTLVHPWIFDIASGVRTYGPNELSWLEAGLRALEGAQISGPAKLDSIVLVTAHVRMLTAQHSGSATTETEIARLMSNIFVQHGDSYPRVAAAFAATASTERNNAFEFGLTRILDGLAVLVDPPGAE